LPYGEFLLLAMLFWISLPTPDVMPFQGPE
jgi:hypothetical protein